MRLQQRETPFGGDPDQGLEQVIAEAVELLVCSMRTHLECAVLGQ